MAVIGHTRCNSLPSAPHPFVSQFEEHFQRVKGSEATTPLSSSSVSHKLDGMQDFHDCTYKLLQLPREQQQALAQEFNDKLVHDLLEGSLRLLDICSTAKDCLMQSKQSVHELQSIIRRRRGDDAGFTVVSAKYFTSRKMMKAIRKALENLKATKSELIASSSNKDNSTLSMLSLLKEAEKVTLSSLESLLLFISDPKEHPKKSRWSIISKLVQPKRVACDFPESDTYEFETKDASFKVIWKIWRCAFRIYK